MPPTFNPDPGKNYAEQAKAHNDRARASRKIAMDAERAEAALASASGHDPLADKPTPPASGRSAAARRTGSASIHRNRVKENLSIRREFQVQLTEDEGYVEACSPGFLGLAADLLRPGFVIRVIGHQLAFVAERLVVRSDEILKSVWSVELWKAELADQIAASAAYDLDQCRIEANGGSYRIVHGTSVIADGFASQEAASRWLRRRASDGADG